MTNPSDNDLTIKAAITRALNDWLSGQGEEVLTGPDATSFIEECRNQIEWLADEAVMEWAEEHGVDASRDEAY